MPQNLQLDEIFAQAIALPASDRAAWLDVACEQTPGMRARVEQLLSSHETPGFMSKSASPSDIETEQQIARLKPEESGERIGNYRLVEQIGEGGFGTVWLAEQEKPVQRQVALKIIKLGMDTREVIARFEQERQTLAVMDHINIAKVYDAGATQFGRPYFVMELVRGTRITDYCDQSCLGIRERLELAIQVCQAVQHAHQKGIIHRDLKPSNILVTLQDGVPVPKVIDFGVAKAIHGRLSSATITTDLEQMIGTPLYMSPEQAHMSGGDIDTRSDIYSLGVLLYELLTGRTPFDHDDFARGGYVELRRLVCEVEPKKPSTALRAIAPKSAIDTARCRRVEPSKLIHTLRGDLDWIVMKAIEKDRTRRYPTANGLALDIQRYLSDEPVSATPPSRTYRFRKFARRNKLGLSAAAAIAAALIIGLIVSLWQADRATRAEKDLTASLAQADASRMKAEASEMRARRSSYGTDMNLAHQAALTNNVGRARELLDRHRPKDGEIDLRGWEWRYLYEQCRSSARVRLTHRGGQPVFSASFSADGKLLVLGYADGVVELWEVATRTRLREIQPQSAESARVAFAPAGETFAMNAGNGTVKTVNARTGAEAVLCTVKGAVRDISYSDDGAWLALLSRPSNLIIVRASDGGTIMAPPLSSGGGAFFNNARISPDKQRIYVSSGAGAAPILRCLSVPDGSVIWERPIGRIDENEPRKGSDRGFSAMDLSPDGLTLVVATGFRDSTVRVLETSKGELRAELKGHNRYVLQLAFSEDGETLASTSEDQTIRLWNTKTWKSFADPLRGHNQEVNAVAFAKDGSLLASGNKDGEVLLWDLQNRGRAIASEFPPHIERVIPLPLSRMVVGQTSAGNWLLIDLLTMAEQPLAASEILAQDEIPAIAPKRSPASPIKLDPGRKKLSGSESPPALSPDGKLVVVASQSGRVGFYDARSLELLEIATSSVRSVFGAAFAPNGERLALGSGGQDGVAVWDVRLRQELVTFSSYAELSGVEFTEDGDTLLIGLDQQRRKSAIHFWHAPSLELIEAAERAGGQWPHAETFSAASPTPSLAQIKTLLEARYRKELASVAAQAASNSTSSNQTLENLARLLRQQHRDAEVAPLLRERLERLKGRAPRDDMALLAATRDLLNAVVSLLQTARQASESDKVALHATEADNLVNELLALFERHSAANPNDTPAALNLALFQSWFGKNDALASTARRLIKQADEKAGEPNVIAMLHAAASASLNPSAPPDLLEPALRLARTAAAATKGTPGEAWFQQTLGLANLRAGNIAEAETALNRAAEIASQFEPAHRKYVRAMESSTRMLRAIALFRGGDIAKAQAVLSAAEAETKPLPADDREIFKSGSADIFEDLIIWIPHREANALIRSKPGASSPAR